MIKFIKLGIAGIFPTRHKREKERLRKLNDKIYLIEDNSFNPMEVKKQPENLNNDEAKLKELDKRIKILEAYILPLSGAMTAAKVLLNHEDRIAKLEENKK